MDWREMGDQRSYDCGARVEEGDRIGYVLVSIFHFLKNEWRVEIENKDFDKR